MSDRKKAFWFIALLSVLVVVPFLGETIFYSKGEPREAIVALSMLESGNWILPVNYGTDIAYKPPFFYWSIAAVSSLFGEVTEFSARFPSALAFLAMQLMSLPLWQNVKTFKRRFWPLFFFCLLSRCIGRLSLVGSIWFRLPLSLFPFVCCSAGMRRDAAECPGLRCC